MFKEREYQLKRSGKAPLAFTGEVVAESSGLRLAKGKDKPGKRDSWHEARVYRTRGGKWVVEVIYQSSYGHETPAWYAEAFDRPEDARAALERYDAGADIRGFPRNHPAYEEKQAALLKLSRERFGLVLADLFSQVPEFSERIE